ncbi:PaaX family transcriptional regulator [Brevibacterium casei]|uniref:PaaX family transcriptional regulator n=1 Tax=Brevibacterium casei TaxID=33889 RepID=UPI00223B8F4E|nr:PaaX family transcriptional regulator C-terminal domain-containing protein [Brevibacterium casei]MCT1764650.1 PaaX family transcriptional regulator [Brevibacterium casei]MCT2357647.1 PaaX family transcriptional regulator [Brevibacterium casei]
MTIPRPAQRHQDLIITLFALYARPPRDRIRIAKLVQLMGDLGYDAPGVRSAISRLKSKGILVSSKLGSQAAYSIDPSMTETIDKGDVRIFADTRPDSAGKWALVTFTVPETQRSLRHQIRSSLTRLGFGNAGQGLWIAPAANLHEAEVVLRRRGLDKYVDFFVGAYVDETQLATKIGQWWDLNELNTRFEPFLSVYAPNDQVWEETLAAAADNDRDAFRLYAPMLTMWRELPYSIPPLPPEFVPTDWNGPRVRSLFYTAHDRLAESAERYVSRVLED